MKNFFILTDALEFIEDNICEKLNSQMVADFCGISLSSLQKLFRIALHKSIKEYINKRRICLAAREILCSDMRFIEIAYKYQFGSPEAFTRAFYKVWNETPSSYKKHWKFSGIFPKLNYQFKQGADEDMAKIKVDISEAYDRLKEIQQSYVICFDIVSMMSINEISREAGDMAIVESARRMDEVCSDTMWMFRIGGDEFAMITGLMEEEDVKQLADRILRKNGECFVWKGKEIPLSLRAGYLKIPQRNLNYGELFSDMQQAIEESKKTELLKEEK